MNKKKSNSIAASTMVAICDPFDIPCRLPPCGNRLQWTDFFVVAVVRSDCVMRWGVRMGNVCIRECRWGESFVWRARARASHEYIIMNALRFRDLRWRSVIAQWGGLQLQLSYECDRPLRNCYMPTNTKMHGPYSKTHLKKTNTRAQQIHTAMSLW